MSDVLIRPHYDAVAKTVTIEEIQDCEAIIDWNKSMQSVPQKSDWGRHIARIPNIILNRWFHEELDRGNVGIKMFGAETDKIIANKLKDPDWRWLRTDL